VSRLPICATSRCGDHERIRTATGQALDVFASARLGYMAHGPSGWTRTTTSRVKSPVCCVHTTEGRELIRTQAPLPHISLGSAYGYRTRPSTLATWDAASTPRPNMDRLFAGPPTSFSFQRPCSFRAGGQQGIRTQPLPWENGVTARQRTIRSYCPFGDSARIRTRTRELWRLGCSRYTTLPLHNHFTIDSLKDTLLP